MDTFDNNGLPVENTGIQPRPEQPSQAGVGKIQQTPQHTAPQTPAGNATQYSWGNYNAAPTYYGGNAGRKESPYANSPYLMNHQNQQGYQGQHAQPGYQWQQNQRPVQNSQAQQPAGFQQTYNYQSPRPAQQPLQQPVKPKEKKKRNMGAFWKTALAAVVLLALVIGSCAITASTVNNHWEAQTEQLQEQFDRQIQGLQEQIDNTSHKATGESVSGSTPASGEGLTPGQVYAQNVNAVVMIYSNVSYYANGQESYGTSAGSGFIVSEDGYILTNYHVIEGANSILVTTHRGQEYDAQVIGSDSTNDVALLKVDVTELPYVAIGSSDDLIVGDQVVAIGNPLGELTSTMTVGYVSGKERSVTTDGVTITMIQTDAAINSGNSGGPLFNMKGEVIGITTAKYSGESSSGASIEGIGFAIPIDDVMEVVSDLIEYGYVKSAYMGVVVREVDTETASMYGLPLGAYVDSVEAGGPADVAGIRAKDIIIGINDVTIEGLNDLSRALRSYEPGDKVTITVYRGGQELELTVELVERPKDIDQPQQEVPQEPEMPSEGDFEDWFEFFMPFFGNGNNND